MSTLYSDRLLAHANAPVRASLPEGPTATASLTNPLCGDRIEVGVRIVDHQIDAIGFSADACAVCVASASVMCQELHGRPVDEFALTLERLDRVSGGEPAPGSDLDMFTVLADFPSRRSCAVLPWRALERALHRPARAQPSQADRRQADLRQEAPPELPSEDLSPWSRIQALHAAGERAVLATLVSIEGSSPCPLGSRMIVSSTGDFSGSVSGGCVESSVVRSALTLLGQDRDDHTASQLLTYSIEGSQAGEAGLVCGGRICVHIAMAPTGAALESHRDAERTADSVRLVPLTGGGARLLTRQSLETRADALSTVALRAFDLGPQRFDEDDESWFVEPMAPLPRLVLVGATHIAQVLARLATELSFTPVIVDPRATLATPRRFPQTRLVLDRPEQALPALLHKRAAVVVLSHDRKLDDPALAAALASDAFYVGALGSRKTHSKRLERLRERGLDEASLGRVRGPAGLAIGGKGAHEIALSILAEVVATRNRATQDAGRVGAVVLAAGSSRRAGRVNKLLLERDGEPMIRRVVRTVLEAATTPCIVVLGHEADRVREALGSLPVSFVVNDSHAEGMGTSIARGVETIAAAGVNAAFIVLGDMPLLRAEDLERLRAAHSASTRRLIIAPEAGEGDTRRLGNPVLWPSCYFDELTALRGDHGAKSILQAAFGSVLRIPIDHRGVLVDVDTVPG